MAATKPVAYLLILVVIAGVLGISAPAVAAPAPGTASSVSVFYTSSKPGCDVRPNDVAVDAQGNVFVALEGYDAGLVKLDPNGAIVFTLVMPAIDGRGFWYGSKHVAVDGQGNAYVLGVWGYPSGASGWYITKVDPSGNIVWRADNPAGTPNDMTVASNGTLYVVGNSGSFMDRLTYNDTSKELDYQTVSYGPISGLVAVGTDVYYTREGAIYKNSWQTKVVTPSQLWNGLAIDSYGYFYDVKWNSIVRQIHPQTGAVSDYVTGFDDSIRGLAADNRGRVWVAAAAPGSSSGSVYVIMPAPPSATSSTVTVDKASITTDETATVTVTLKNDMGYIWSGRQVVLEASPTDAVITPVNNGITDAAGVATFTVAYRTVEPQVTFAAKDVASNVYLAQAARLAVTVGAAARLAWGARPGTGTADVEFSPQPIVRIVDAYGNLRTGDSGGTVTLTASDGVPLAGNTATITGGIAAFSGVKTTKAGTFTVTASAGGSITDVACSVTVAPNQLRALRWVATGFETGAQPISGTQGQYISANPRVPSLALYDAYGNFRATDTGTSVMLMASDGEFLFGNLEKSVNGIVEFPNVLSENAGTFTLQAVAYPSIYSSASAPITISPASLTPNTKLSTLRPGMTVSFAGHLWTVVNPASGLLILRDPLTVWSGDTCPSLAMPFDSGFDPRFDPSRPANVAYYLNNTFYNSLPAAAQGYIQTHTWTTGPYGGSSNDREAETSVVCKVGLISYSEFQTYKGVINWASEYWWTRTPASRDHVWAAMYDTVLGQYSFDQLTIRPAVYLHPDLPLLGTEAPYAGCPGFPAPDLRAYPTPTTVSAGGTTVIRAASGAAVTPNVAGNRLVVRVSATPVPQPNFGDPAPSGDGVVDPYVPESQITAPGWSYIGVYEIDSATNTVRAFTRTRVPKGVTWVRMSKMWTSLTVNGFEQLTATYQPSANRVEGGTWRSSDTGVARVSATGLVTAVGQGTAVITLTAADGLTTECSVDVTLAPASEVTLSEDWPSVPVRNTPVDIDIPVGVDDASLSTAATASGGKVTATLPEITATATTTLGDVDLRIPNTTQISGPMSWNGTITLPHVVNNPPIRGGYVDVAIEVGLGDTPLTLSQPVRLLLKGQAFTPAGVQRFVGFTQNGVFRPIPFIGTDPSLDTPAAAIGQQGDGFLILGTDVVIWTKHFTTFVAYEPRPEPEPDQAPPASVTGYIEPLAGQTISLGSEASLTVPEGALRGSTALPVSIARVDAPPAPPAGYAIVGAYQCTVNGGDYSFQAPVTLTFTFDPAKIPAGLVPAVYYYDSAKGQWNIIASASMNGNTISAQVDHFTVFAVMGAPPLFADVPATHWGCSAIRELTGRGIASGYPDGTFRPDDAITRAEFASLLVKALGLPADGTASAFADVPAGEWFSGPVNAAARAGLVSGIGDGRFAPNALITRQELAVMVARALGEKAPTADDTVLGQFTDGEQVSDWAITGMKTAVTAGIVGGVGQASLAPRVGTTRAEAATMLMRMLRVLGK